jgi:hypothetical protein
VAERQQETTAVPSPLQAGVVDNWPDTGPCARPCKRADAGQVSLCGDDDDEAGTDGQVGRRRDCGRGSERT